MAGQQERAVDKTRRGIFTFPIIASLALTLDTFNLITVNAQGTDKSLTNPSMMVEIIENTALEAGAGSVSVAVFSRKDLQQAGSTTEYANKGLRSTIANGLRMVVQAVYSKILRAAGKIVGETEFVSMVQDEFTVTGMQKGREVYAKLMGIAVPLSDADTVSLGNQMNALFLKETGTNYPFKGSDIAKDRGTNTATMPQIIAALNYAILSLSDSERAAYNKPEVPAAGKTRNMAWLLNPRNYGTLPVGIYSDAGVFQTNELNPDTEGKVRFIKLFTYVADKSGVMRAFMIDIESGKLEANDAFSVRVQKVLLPVLSVLMSNGIYNIS